MNTLFIKLCLKCTFYTNQPKKDVCEHGYVYYAVFIYESGTQAATHTHPHSAVTISPPRYKTPTTPKTEYLRNY